MQNAQHLLTLGLEKFEAFNHTTNRLYLLVQILLVFAVCCSTASCRLADGSEFGQVEVGRLH